MTDPISLGAPGAEFARFLEQEEARRQFAQTALVASKAALFPVLAAASIIQLDVEFDGEGDSGQIESIEARGGDAIVDLPSGTVLMSVAMADGSGLQTRPCPIRDAVETLAYDCLEDAAGGWENNNGAFGTIRFDVATQTITLELNTRVSESVCSEHVF